jgi:hypothetical protein
MQLRLHRKWLLLHSLWSTHASLKKLYDIYEFMDLKNKYHIQF